MEALKESTSGLVPKGPDAAIPPRFGSTCRDVRMRRRTDDVTEALTLYAEGLRGPPPRNIESSPPKPPAPLRGCA